MMTNVEISAGLEEIKQMLFGMQQQNKQFWDEQVIQIRSLRHTFNQGDAELSRLHALVSEQTEAMENPDSVETPHEKAKEDDYDILAKREASENGGQPVTHVMAAVKVLAETDF